MNVQRAVSLPIRLDASWDARWRGEDGGLIASWEAGRKLAIEKPELASLALLNQLPLLPWKGGFPPPGPKKDAPKTQGKKYGSFFYLAMWQGLRGEPLSIDTEREVTMVCALTQKSVTFTALAAIDSEDASDE